MSLLASFITLFETNAREAEADMASAEAQADALADAMAGVGAVDAAPIAAAAEAAGKLAAAGRDAAASVAHAADVDAAPLAAASEAAEKLADAGRDASATMAHAADVDVAPLAAASGAAGKLADAGRDAASVLSHAADINVAPLAAAVQEAEALTDAAESTVAINEMILSTALDIAEAERNIQQYLLGNEEITEKTLRLIGGQEGLQERVVAETKKLAQELIKAEHGASKLTDELTDAKATSADLSKSFMGMVRSIAGPLAAVVSVGAAIGGVKAHVAEVTQLIERASRARIDVAAYDQWRRAITAAGGSAEQAESQFDAFGERVMEAFGDAESEGGKALAQLGVSAKDAAGNIKPTEQALMELAGAMEGVSREVAVNNLRRLGIVDPTMVDLILKGKDALQASLDVQKRNGALTVEQANRYKELRTTLASASDAWSGFVNTLLGGVIPAWSGLMQQVTKGIEWLTRNKNVVQGFGIALGASLAIAAGVALAVYAPAMYAAAAATIAATWPILAIIAAILAVSAAFALAYDDVRAFMDGQPSMLGELVKKYGWVRDAVEWIGRAFKAVAPVAGAVLSVLKRGAEVLAPVLLRIAQLAGGRLVEAFKRMASFIQAVWAVAGPVLGVLADAFWTLSVVAFNVGRRIYQVISALFNSLEPVARPALEVIGGLFRAVGAVMGGVADMVKAAWSAFFGWFVDKVERAAALARGLMAAARTITGGGDGGDSPRRPGGGGGGGNLGDMVRTAQDYTRAADRAPTNAVTGSAVAAGRPANRSTTVQIDKVDVNTQATDAKGIASAFASSLQSETRRAVQDSDDGVSH